jgi:hypothetical protein
VIIVSSQYRIKITDSADPGCNAYSDYFTIEQPAQPCSISIIGPTSGTSWTEDDNHTISWNHSGASGTVNIELYESTSLLCVSSQYRIKITDSADPGCNAYSDYFTIEQPAQPCSISIISPTSGATWTEGENRTILWNHSGASGTVTIELYESTSLLCAVASSTANDGSYQWTVDDCGGGVSSQYRIKVTDSAYTGCNAYSDYFTISTGSGTSYRKVYQQGVDGYTGCEDTYMILWKPDLKLEGEIFIESMTDDGREPAGGMRPLIRFNQLGLAGRVVQACTLQVWCYLVIGDAQVLQLHEVLRDWEPEHVTPRAYGEGLNWTEFGCGLNDQDAGSSPVSSIVDNSGEQEWTSLPLPTSLVQRWVDSPGDENNGVLLWAPEFGVIKDRSFRSAEMFIEGQRPRLIIHYEDD